MALRRTKQMTAVLLAAPVLLLAGCSDHRPTAPEDDEGGPLAADHGSAVARAWFELASTLTRTTAGYTPPVAARTFGYAGLALYEALVPGMPGHRSLVGVLNGLAVMPEPDPGAEYHWPSVANAVLAETMRRFYPTATADGKAAIAALEADRAADFADDADAAGREASIAWGRAVAAAVHDYSRSDGGHEGWTRNFPASFVPPTGPGLWVPTGAQTVPMQPFWGTNRPFVLAAGGNPNVAVGPNPPPAYSEDPSSAFWAEALEVHDAVDGVTPEQQAIAEFWADDPGLTATPPGHSLSVLTQVLAAEDAPLSLAAEAYAKLGMAVSDAFVSCWYTKFVFNLVRPITYIHDVMGDAAWDTIVATPPFPEYTSGHSVQSGAMAAVMTDLFGDGYAFVDHTHDARVPPLPARAFASFAAAADEAAISRLYGGIHYRAAIEEGVTQGAKVGALVNGLPFTE